MYPVCMEAMCTYISPFIRSLVYYVPYTSIIVSSRFISKMTEKVQDCYRLLKIEAKMANDSKWNHSTKMKSTKVQTLGALTRVRDVAHDDIVCDCCRI